MLASKNNKLAELFGIDLRSLAALRVGLGFALLTDLLSHAPNLRAHFSDEGILPRVASELYYLPGSFSVHLASGQWQVQGLLLAIQLGLAVMFLIGYRTRFTTFLSWFLLVSLQNRNPYVLQGADVLLRMMLFWGCFLPLGARFSFDRWLGPGGPLPQRLLSGGSLGYMTQFVLMYFFSALFKLQVPEWNDGRAIAHILEGDPFTSVFGRWMLQFPLLLKWATHAVTKAEILGPFLLFFPIVNGPIRMAVLAVFMFLQLGFALCLNLGEFPFIAFVSSFGFLPTWFWERIPRVRLRLPAGWLQALRRLPASTSPLSSMKSNLVASCFILLVVYWNLGTLDAWKWKMPSWMLRIVEVTRVDQTWNLFVNHPLKMRGWYVIPATLKDGSRVDLFSGGALTYDPPKLVSATFPDQRWRKYLSGFYYNANRPLRPYYARYLCSSWNAAHKPDRWVRNFEIVYMWWNSQTDGFERLSLIQWSCDGDRAS